VVYGLFTTAKPRSRRLSKRIERTGGYFAPPQELESDALRRPVQGIPGGDVALPAKPFIEDQPLDLFL
jgi:hypothetical protein